MRLGRVGFGKASGAAGIDSGSSACDYSVCLFFRRICWEASEEYTSGLYQSTVQRGGFDQSSAERTLRKGAQRKDDSCTPFRGYLGKVPHHLDWPLPSASSTIPVGPFVDPNGSLRGTAPGLAVSEIVAALKRDATDSV